MHLTFSEMLSPTFTDTRNVPVPLVARLDTGTGNNIYTILYRYRTFWFSD